MKHYRQWHECEVCGDTFEVDSDTLNELVLNSSCCANQVRQDMILDEQSPTISSDS